MEDTFYAALNSSPDELLCLAAKNQSRPGKVSLKAALHRSDKKQAASLCNALASFASAQALAFQNLQNSQFHCADTFKTPSPKHKRRKRACCSPTAGKKSEVQDNGRNGGRAFVMANLKACALVAQYAFSHPLKVFQPCDLFPAVQILHDQLVFFEDDAELQDIVAGLCESWWKDHLPGRESLIAQSVPFLLSKSLEVGRKVNVHRVYSMRDAFTMFDFVDETIEDLKHLLMRCVLTPAYLRSTDGRRFISFLFNINVQLTKELIVMVKSQIPFGRKSILEAYGEIIFRAWKTASEPCVQEIENSCLQSLLEGAVYASSKALASSTRKVLSGFISQKAQEGVEALLFRLQEPILFRSLQVANSNVRRNALLLLIDMFPLENPDASKEENDNLLERQFLFLEKLLADQCPDVRITAVQGVCRILRLFWEVIPSGITVKLLSKIVDDIAHDNSSSTVRCAVLQGITYLLENPASHDLLKAIITKLGPLLNDCNLSVRIEMANMLLALKGIRTISFLKVSSLESLLSALECDKPPVARRLTRLLIPSYFPSKVSLEEACNRCVALIKRAPQSGVRFCEWALQEGVPASSLLELVKVLCNLVGSPDALKDEEKEGIFAALNELCHKLANQKELKVSLGEILTRDMLKALLMNATTSKSRTSIIEMVSVINPTDVPELFVYCSQVVSNFSKDTLNPINCNEARSVHSLMLAWGGFNDLVKTLIRNFAQVSKLDERFGWPRSAVKSLKKKKLESKSPWTKSMKGKVSVAKARKDVTVTGLAEDLRNALCAAWHAENLVEVEEMRQALLVDENLPALLSGLRNTVHFVFHSGIEIPVPDFLKASPLRAYATLAVHMTLNEKTGKRARDARESGIDHRNPVDYVCEELIQWAENLQSLPKLSSPISHKKRQVKHSRSLRTPCRGALTDISNGSSSCTKDSTAERCSEAELFVSKGKILNTLLESLLYFLSLNLVKDEALQYKCLEFAKKLMEWLLNCLRMWDTLGAKNKVSGVIGKDSLLCTRMCTAHCGKMLYVTLRKNTEGALKSADLSNCLLDSIFFSESVFGGKGAMSLFTSLNPWFPDVFISISSWATDLILNDLSADVSCLCFDDLVQLGNKSLKPWVVNLLTAASETYSQHGDQPGCPMAEDECTYGENAQEIEDAFQPAMDQNFSFSSEMLKRMSNLLCNGDPVVLGGILNLFLWHAAASLQTKNYAVVVGAVQIACRSIHSCKLFSEGAQSKQHLWEQFVAACEVMITQINVISDKKDSLPQLDSKALLRVKDLVQNLLASERR